LAIHFSKQSPQTSQVRDANGPEAVYWRSSRSDESPVSVGSTREIPRNQRRTTKLASNHHSNQVFSRNEIMNMVPSVGQSVLAEHLAKKAYHISLLTYFRLLKKPPFEARDAGYAKVGKHKQELK
jgi:hypothetical protein